LQSTHMHKFYFFALVFLSFGARSETHHPIEMCIDHFPPRHIIVEGEEPTGYSVETVKAIAKQAGLTLTFTPNIPFARCLRMLKNGHSDVMAGLVRSEEREQYMAFIPYNNQSKKRFFSLKTFERNITSLADLNGVSIAIIRGFEYPIEFESEFDSLDIIELGSIEAALEAVRLGRVDVTIITDYQGVQLGSVPRFKALMKAHPLTFKTDEIYLGISKKGKAMEFLPQIRNAIETLKNNGSIDKILNSPIDIH